MIQGFDIVYLWLERETVRGNFGMDKGIKGKINYEDYDLSASYVSQGTRGWQVGYDLGLDARVRVFNVPGEVMMQFAWNGETVKLDCSGFPQGIYFIEVLEGDAKEVLKLVID